ncbi:hypothetical protein CCR95_23240 [Thiocystis minor]|uniref:AAA family ATPase n=1 Tax=Thiocystis minor TaxID=61597 RepID=UPI00191223E7|nr:AAA family ATPase [Thiocystis minor]MBK5966903.1 hypothetical protein [Thiocystis minor]
MTDSVGQHRSCGDDVRRFDPTDAPLLIKRSTREADADAGTAALENEWHILERLQGIAGCPRLIRFDPERSELILSDPGGRSLTDAGLLGQVDLARFLAIGESLARLLAAIHARGVIHGAIDPDRVLIGPEDDRLWLFDYAQSTTFAEEPSGLAQHRRPVGAPAYWSPEQTGRMNRPVDYRTDLYSLGLTLYALITGAPPFQASDPLALIHAHLARDPDSPRQRVPWLPDPPARAVLCLLAKEPDDRYQSALGLANDLRRLREALKRDESLDAIRLREHDPPLSPLPPRRLYGRERELASLMAAFMAVTEGESRALFVAGVSGIGKTALVHEILRPVTLSQGLFVGGKCEQFQRDRPLLAPARALARLCQLLLAEPESIVAEWRTRLLDGLGPDAAALFEPVPELEWLLGPQPPVPALGPIETRARLHGLLVTLVRRIATPARPLVLFLDDLQWADPSTFEFLGALLEGVPIPGLLLIGAYRDQEVETGHPLANLLRRPTAGGAPPTVLTLDALAPERIAALLAVMLRLSPEESRPLARQLHDKTGGNPFFTLELLNALRREGTLWLDQERGRWVWDEAALRRRAVSANLVDLLAATLSELADDTTEDLLTAACLSHEVSLGRLARATGRAPRELVAALTPALERGILVTADALALQAAHPGVELRFCHDRMQQAVHQLRDEAGHARLHRAIARHLVETGDPRDRLCAAEQYALARALITQTDERALARALATEAALQARRSGAFDAAERFLRFGLELLPEDAWRTDRDAALLLQTELHLMLYGQGRNEEADAVYDRIAAEEREPARLLDAACTQIVNLTKRTRFQDAIRLGCDLLTRLGVTVPLDDLDQTLAEIQTSAPDVFCLRRPGQSDTGAFVRPESALGQELDHFYRHLDAGALDRLSAAPDLTDPCRLGAARLLDSLLPAANFTHAALVSWLPLRAGRLWIEEGFCESVLCPFISIGPVIMAFRGDYATADRLALAALEVGAARGAVLKTAHGWYVYTGYISHWRHPVEDNIAHARRVYAELVRMGDQPVLPFINFSLLAALLDSGQRLAELDAAVATALSAARHAGNRHGEQVFLTYRQLIRALEGRASGPGSLGDADFDEEAFVTQTQRNPTARGYFHLHRALSALLFDDAPALARHADAARALTHFVQGKYPTALVNLLHSLALIERLRAPGESGERGILLERLTLNQTWLAARAADAPVNFGHLHDLIEAERLDALGESWAALQAMERALRLAQGHQRPWHRALITERAGLLHMRHGLEHSGRALLTLACQRYLNWGATAKAESMRRDWPFVAARRPDENPRASVGELDQSVLLRASEALASETSRAGLMKRMLELVAQLTGATDVRFLVLDEEGQWSLEGGLRGAESLAPMSLAEAEAQGLVAMSVLRLGLATLQPVLSDDAVLDSRFAADPHFAGLPLCSLLGLPLVVQGRVNAFLTLENRRLRAAFATDQVLDLLGGMTREVPLLQSRRLASLGSLMALHSVLDARNQALRESQHQALERARQALDEARRERAIRDQQGQFIDLITHEYRTPLAIMQTNLDILMLSQNPEHWRDGLHNLGLAIQRLGEVFDGSLRRGDWGEHRQLCLEPIEWSDWLARRIEETRAGWPAPAPSIDLRAQGPVTIQADPALLKTALINLLDNARKYGPAEGMIEVELMVSDGQAVLTVANDCPLDLARETTDLLSKSVRGANSKGIPGLGMGLYLVNKLVADQGGQVELRRERPERFEIRLSFPLVQAESAP